MSTVNRIKGRVESLYKVEGKNFDRPWCYGYATGYFDSGEITDAECDAIIEFIDNLGREEGN